jgi:DNA primase
MTVQWVEYSKIKQAVSLADVLGHYGFSTEVNAKGEIKLRCPFHRPDKTPSFSANPAKGGFQCFGCGVTGNVIELVRLFEGIDSGDHDADTREVACRAADIFRLTFENPKEKQGRRPKQGTQGRARPRDESKQKGVIVQGASSAAPEDDTGHIDEHAHVEPTTANVPLTWAYEHLDQEHPYLAERGLSKETIAHFGVGYQAGKGMMHGRVVIPIHNEAGELVAYVGRWPGEPPQDEPKYKFPPKFAKAQVLYNLHRAQEYATDGLIVVEGFMSVFALWQQGRRNVVALMGCSLSEAQEQLLVETVGTRGRILLALDADDAGRKGMKDAADRLVSQVFVRTVELNN